MEKPKKELDFIVIGAAKSGTTTLYELLKGHSELYMPKGKEVPYFSDNKVYKKGINKYFVHHFKNADTEKLWGTITPQYMIGQKGTDPKIVEKRIYKDMSNAKIIAILRNPIDRAFSHYRMLVKRGYETRNFDEAVNDLIKGNTGLSGYDEPDNDYLAFSKYGEILQPYFDNFPNKNILILTSDELRDKPDKTLAKIFKFLNIDSSYTTSNVKKEARKGGSKPKVKYLTPGFIFKIPLVKKIWQDFTPQPIRKRVEYSINLWNTKPDNEKLDKSSLVYKKLVKYFDDDVKLLSKITNKSGFWSSWK